MKKIINILLCLFLAAGLAGCGAAEEDLESTSLSATGEAYLYYLNSDGDQLVRVPYQMNEPDRDGQVMELIALQGEKPKDATMQPLLPDGVSIKDRKVEDTTLTLDLSGDLSQVSGGRKTLMAGGLAKTFLQVDGLDELQITAGGKKLTDSYGQEVGPLSLTDFFENDGKNINDYTSKTMTLYFTDETGTELVPEVRTVHYSSNEPVERAVIDELIKGPEEAGNHAVLSSDTNVLSVTNQDGICYVNFDDSVESPIFSVRADIPVYAITNSLIDTVQGIKHVQISINGDSNMKFRESVDLSKPFSKNGDLIEK